MIDWLASNGPTMVTLVFFAMFLAFAFWAYRPANKQKMQSYGNIPLRESEDGE